MYHAPTRTMTALAWALAAVGLSACETEILWVDPPVHYTVNHRTCGDEESGQPSVEVGIYEEQFFNVFQGGIDAPISTPAQGGNWLMPAVRTTGIRNRMTDGKKTLLDSVPRMAAAGPGMGGRPVNPHTTRTIARFSASKTCHLKKDKSNLAAVRATWGFGSDRYLFKDGAGKTWRLDQMMTDDYKSVIESGHPEPFPALPLSKAQVEAMKAVLVD